MKPLYLWLRMVVGILAVATSLEAAPLMETVGASQYGPYIPGRGDLLRHTDGDYYGITLHGGTHGDGTIFKVSPQGTITLLHSFGPDGTSHGRNPFHGLVSDGAGYLWGTTASGGANDLGSIFKFHPASGKFTRVIDFTGTAGAARGENPNGTMFNDGQGFLWGVTSEGGHAGKGTLFKINLATETLTTVLEFTGATGSFRGQYPHNALTPDGTGYLWGVTKGGGTSSEGTLFKVRLSDGAFTSVFSFTGGAGGSEPESIMRSGNYIWGVTFRGGTSGNYGTVFKYHRTFNLFTTVVRFTNASGSALGAYPSAPLYSDGAGNLYGVTAGGGTGYQGTIFRIAESSGTFTTLVDFYSPGNEGATPSTGLVKDSAGYLWGMGQNSDFGHGVIFKYHPTTADFQTVAIMHDTMPGLKGPGVNSVIRIANGDWWGTTSRGGDYEQGTVFKMNPTTGFAETLVEFTGFLGTIRGGKPMSALCEDGLGYVWGTTPHYGATHDHGTLFKINVATGQFTTVLSFTNTTTGSARGKEPVGALVRDNLGYLWGITRFGGASSVGTIYMVNPNNGTVITVFDLTGIAGLRRGSNAETGLVKDSNGMLWGTTPYGGAGGRGTIFKIDPISFTFTNVASFTNGAGALPGKGGLPLRSQGNFIHGASANLGTNGFGYLFSIDISSNLLTPGPSFDAPAPSSFTPDPAGFLWGNRNVIGDLVTEEPAYAALLKVNPATGQVTTAFESFGTQHDYVGFGPSPLVSNDGHLYGGSYSDGPGGAGYVFRLRFGPAPVTLTASGVTPSSAVLRGTVNPNGSATQIVFEWGTTPSLGNVTPIQNIAAGSTAVSFNAPLSGLTPQTTYYFRVRATNSDNPNPQYGQTRSFKTTL
jgi:uncharacterized repeat protein (TIGR03803 family)